MTSCNSWKEDYSRRFLRRNVTNVRVFAVMLSRHRRYGFRIATTVAAFLVIPLVTGCRSPRDDADMVLARKLDEVQVLVDDLESAIGLIEDDRTAATSLLREICDRSDTFSDSLYGPNSLWGRDSYSEKLGDWVPDSAARALFATHAACPMYDLLLGGEFIQLGIEIARFRDAASCLYDTYFCIK